jgi:peptidoglycan/LPS O-acetylase OafA/YrhL
MRKAELRALTGIRFYAAAMVYLSHVAGTIPGMPTLAGSRLIFNAGEISVAFFFVLSGFIIAYNYLDRFKSRITLSAYRLFVWDRFSRIYPVHLLALFLILPVALNSPNLPLDWRAVPIHLLLLQCWWPSPSPPFLSYLNVPSWSLSCEWFFYLLAPIAMYMTSNKRRWLVLLLGILCFSVGLSLYLINSPSDHAKRYFVAWFAPSRFVDFVAGIFIAWLFVNIRLNKLHEWPRLVQVSGIVLIVAGAAFWQSAPWVLSGGLLILPGSALLILGLATGEGFLSSHLSHRWLHSLGIASFAFYMIHAPILRWAKGLFLYEGWEVSTWPLFWGVTLIFFGVIQLAALGVLWCYEIPLQQRLRAFARKVQPAYDQ